MSGRHVGDVGTANEVTDRAINHIFGSGLTLASIVNRRSIDDDIARRLLDVIDALDAALRELQSGRLFRDRPRAVTASRESNARRRLRGVADDEVFAYAMRGHDFYRARDDELWAHDSDGLLLSARSGMPFARRVGNVFHDITSDQPLYYEERGSLPDHTPATEVVA